MKNKALAQNIKNLRNRKGFSQEELAVETGLSLRTIQRIENGETEPRGDSLKRLAATFEVTPDELVDWTVTEDHGFLTSLNLSSLSFIFFPLLGILVPLILWISKKDKIKNLNKLAKDLLNFQITWTIILSLGYFGIAISAFYKIRTTGDIDASLIKSRIFLNLAFWGGMYIYNLILIIYNSIQIHQGHTVFYKPAIPFLRK